MKIADLKELDYITVQEAARILRTSNMTIYRLVHEKTLSTVQFGRSIRISVPEFVEFLARNENQSR